MSRPAPSHRFRRRAARAGCLLLLTLLSACGEGDFGRIRSSLVTDDIHAWIGAEAVASAGGVPSLFPLTDDERQLRDLAYPLIEPPYDRQRSYSILGEYGLLRFRYPALDYTTYGRLLMTRPARSEASRYSLLIEDIRNDITRLDPFFRVAARVADMDSKRAQALPYIPELSEGEYFNAVNRIGENGLAIEWVKHSLHHRVGSYRYALERLVIVTPSPQAVQCEQTLNRLAALVEQTTVAAVPPPWPRKRVVAR